MRKRRFPAISILLALFMKCHSEHTNAQRVDLEPPTSNSPMLQLNWNLGNVTGGDVTEIVIHHHCQGGKSVKLGYNASTVLNVINITSLEPNSTYTFTLKTCLHPGCTSSSKAKHFPTQKVCDEDYKKQTKPIVCYYTWNGPKDLQPEKIDPNLCSHIIIGFASVQNLSVQIGSEMEDGIRRTVALKTQVPDLKILFSIGGGANEHGFTEAVRTEETRRMFIDSILAVINRLELDGVDIDWEFPSWFADIHDKNNFVHFLKEYRYRMDKVTKGSLLTVAVAAKIPIIKMSYDATALAAYTDFINLMTYGFHDYNIFEDPFTGFNSPLFPRSLEKSYFATLNMAFAAEYWLKLGIPKSKLYVGLPVYAHTYTLELADNNGVDAPASGGGQDWSYSQCCDFLKSGATRVFNNESLVPYAYKGLQWISYDDQESLTYKANWLRKQDFGGAMIFNLNTDDWQNKCGIVDFPLIKLIRNILEGNN